MAATNPDSKRPRLNSWESTSSSSSLPHEFQTHPPHPPSHPQHSSPYTSLSTGPVFWGEMKTPPHPIQHTLSHQRSHSVPSQPPGGKNVSLHHTQQSHPGQSANSHALGTSGAHSPRATHVQQTPLQMPLGPNSNPNPGYQTYQPQHQLQKLQSGIDGSSSTSLSSCPAPLMRTAIDQQQVQQLRPLSVSGHSSTPGNHPQYPGDSFYIQQGLTQSGGDARGSLGVDTLSPGSTATLAPGPSPIMTSGGFPGGQVGLMNQHMSGVPSVGGQHMNGATSPVTTPTSAGGMMANGLQGMGVVTTYPPRRKAIRAAQACDACRARKAKCDEGRPSCGFCKESQIPCVYREVPPPKQDRTLLQILERLGRVESLLDTINSSGRTYDVSRLSDTATTTAMRKDVSTATEQTQTPGQAVHQSPPFYRPSPGPTTQSATSAASNQNSHIQPTNNTPAEVLLEEDEQLAIPFQHTTAAHKLMWWPGIRKLIDAEFLANDAYVVEEEEKRGPLRVHGRGEGIDTAESWLEDMDEGDTGYVWDSGIRIDEGMDANWGISEDTPMEDGMIDGMGYRQAHRQTSGHSEGSGLTTGGGLRMDRQTILRLLNSYLSNIHILHPVLDRSTITKMTFMFAERVASPPQTSSPTTPYATTPGPVGLGLGVDGENGGMQSPNLHRRGSSASVKRKRSVPGSLGSMQQGQMQSMNSQAGSHPVPPQRIPKTIHSALVLLVLALGAVCLHRKPVPGALQPTPVSPTFRNSTPSFKTSTPPFSASTPPYHSYSQHSSSVRQKGRELRNIDVIPGLAYFGKAMEIMGVLMGGNELENVQVCLLAGLYWGQLGRVLDSWKWISYACMGCQILVRMRLQSEKDELRKDLILRAFWSCLQLESDVLAELDLPPSGISRLEDAMPLPSSIALPAYDAETKEDDPLMWMYYLAQIALRKLLNRAHTTLYNKDKGRFDSPRSLAIAKELDYQLEQWKLHLPEPLRWDEPDAPSSDINAARLRAKYFGARYIIHRPFIYHVIHASGVSSGTIFSSLSPGSEMSQHGSPAATTPNHSLGVRRTSTAGEEIASASLEVSCRKCLDSAVQSTTAFHAFSPEDNRPIITNVFGTAHAQFGNLLVLQAAYQSPALKNMIAPRVLCDLITKTIRWLQTLAPISSALRKDAQILENAASKLDYPLQGRLSHY